MVLENQIAVVKYQIASYSGTIEVSCRPDDDTDVVIAKAKARIRRLAGGSLPFGSESFRIIERY